MDKPKTAVRAERPPAVHRRYTKRQKATAVIAAELVGATAAAEQAGMPRKTVATWMDRPEYAELRRKTREDMADEMRVIAYLALEQITLRIGDFEPRDLSILLGIAIDKSQLLAGQATERTETLEVPAFSDQERELLADAIHRELATRGEV